MAMTMSRRAILGAGAAAVALPLVPRARATGEPLQGLIDLTSVTAPPTVWPATSPNLQSNQTAVFYEGATYRGVQTRVFAIIGLPSGALSTAKVPGVVLAHGGGGTAYAEWVRKWTDRGFAAIAMALEGQLDVRDEDDRWVHNPWGGPSRNGIYQDQEDGVALPDQWMWHAQWAVIRAHTLLASFAEVNTNRIGLHGISWGGVITATNIGIDQRSAFAIPVYGCGFLDEMTDNQYGRALQNNLDYDLVWEPGRRLGHASMPTLWLTGQLDQHFSLVQQAKSYQATGSAIVPAAVRPMHMVSIQPGLAHGHDPVFGLNASDPGLPDPQEFATRYLDSGQIWAEQTSAGILDDGRGFARFRSDLPLVEPMLHYATGTGHTRGRVWTAIPARIELVSGIYRLSAAVPTAATAWFFNAKAQGTLGALTLSSDLVTRGPQ